jgi:hypothetical protein
VRRNPGFICDCFAYVEGMSNRDSEHPLTMVGCCWLQPLTSAADYIQAPAVCRIWSQIVNLDRA